MMLRAKLCILFLLFSSVTFAHEGHHLALENTQSPALPFFETLLQDGGNLIRWMGRFHLVILHFPIALTIMTVVAELLFIFYRKPLFEQAAYFMIIAAALWAVPTAILGLAFSWGVNYEDLQRELFEWHRYFGVLTVILAIIAAYLRYDYFAKHKESLLLYYCTVFFLFISVSLTGVFGGSLAFGYLVG